MFSQMTGMRKVAEPEDAEKSGEQFATMTSELEKMKKEMMKMATEIGELNERKRQRRQSTNSCRKDGTKIG